MTIDQNRFNGEVEKLRAYSSRLQTISENHEELVKQLNSLSVDSRASLFSAYQHVEGPVKKIREKVARILSQRNILLPELKTIIANAVAEKPDSFDRMYKSWYSMLYMFLIADFRAEMLEAINYICTSVIDELSAAGQIVAKKFDFTGERETGSTRCWIAFFNHTHAKQSTAKQLFLNIQNGEIEFCLYDRPNDHMTDRTVINKGEQFDFAQLIAVFQKHKSEILANTWVPKINYWRIGTKDRTTSYWEEMESSNKVCIGWPEIGDLKLADIRSKKTIIRLLADKGYYEGDNRTKSKKAGEILSFYNGTKTGDIVLAQDGATVLGIGRINGEYSYNESAAFPHQKPVEWLQVNPELWNEIGLQTTVYPIENDDTISKIKTLLSSSGPASISLPAQYTYKMPLSLNQILYGPPGTGKTYHTINRALEIINDNEVQNLDWDNREQVKALFDKKVQEGQIVFTTFHQSMSYEDFIEGIKPVEPDKEGAPVTYRIESGIFKNLCVEAAFAMARLRETKETDEVLDFSNLYDSLAEQVEERIAQGEIVTLPTKGGGSVLVEEISQQGNFIIKHRNGARTYTVSKSRLTKLNTAIPNLDDVNNIYHQFSEIIGGSNSSAYWSVLNAVKNHKAPATRPKENRNYTAEERAEVVTSLSKDDYKNKTGKPYVLIIDEINRGNVSQIFGELITLIEEDKRLGKGEALEATLPYSKEKFGVPPNLYIIGTMNTADRSVEALDAALRRRFSFEEKAPRPDQITTIDGEAIAVNEISLPLLLTVINKRIEKLLDKDHQIGHSYFMSVVGTEDLQKVFYNKIVPLLQEYFFGSYDKIGLVLGDGFVRLKNNEEYVFADFDSESAADFEYRPVYEIIDYRLADHNHWLKINNTTIEMSFEKALKRLMKLNIV